MTRYLPPTVVCANDECAMAGQCMRHMDYAAAKKDALVIQILNTSLPDVRKASSPSLLLVALIQPLGLIRHKK